MRAGKRINRIVFTLIFTAMSTIGIQCTSVKKQKVEKPMDHKKFSKLFRSARKLTPEEARELDKLVDKEPDNLDAVTKWLIYNLGKRFKNEKIKKKREKIILHLIEKHPECTILNYPYTSLYKRFDDTETAKALWKAQLKKHPENLKILSNAARSTLFFDRQLSEKCLKTGQKLEPENPIWSIRLGNLYRYNSIATKNNKGYEKSYKEYKRAYKQTAVNKRSSILKSLGQVTYILGKNKDAEKYANEMLEFGHKSTRKYIKGSYLYNANTLLGLLALRNGKTEEACKYLIKSSDIIAANKLPYFYADMSLACMLTFKKQDKCVLKFLETLSKHSSKGRYKTYIKDLKAGVMPNYGGMSYYNYVPLMNKINTARRKKFLSIGKALSPKEAAVLEKELAKWSNKKIYSAYGTITKLVAYYYINKDKDKTIPEKRRQLVYRLVEYFPRYSLLAYPETWLRSGGKDKKLIALCKASIKKSKAGDACPLHKAAYQVATHDNKLAEEAFLKACKKKSSASEKKKILARFHSRVKAGKPYMNYKK